MNLEVAIRQTAEAEPAALTPCPEAAPRGPRIEPCEFENLLQRAMEILNRRHLEAQLAAKRG